jgi:hypothetical protein
MPAAIAEHSKERENELVKSITVVLLILMGVGIVDMILPSEAIPVTRVTLALRRAKSVGVA